MWICKNWTRLKISDMTDNHLINAAKYSEKIGNCYDELEYELKKRRLLTDDLLEELDLIRMDKQEEEEEEEEMNIWWDPYFYKL